MSPCPALVWVNRNASFLCLVGRKCSNSSRVPIAAELYGWRRVQIPRGDIGFKPRATSRKVFAQSMVGLSFLAESFFLKAFVARKPSNEGSLFPVLFSVSAFCGRRQLIFALRARILDCSADLVRTFRMPALSVSLGKRSPVQSSFAGGLAVPTSTSGYVFCSLQFARRRTARSCALATLLRLLFAQAPVVQQNAKTKQPRRL